MSQKIEKISKFLSFVLRHQPESIGICLSSEGWVRVDELIEQANLHGTSLNRELIETVVVTSDKKRFTISACGQMIRAAQGHSTAQVEIQYQAITPPEMLYHGTALRFLNSIKDKGLLPQGRHLVHLSTDIATATSVGSRHGKVHVLKIHSLAMHKAGYEFYLSENGVWLTQQVPVEFIEFE